MAIEFSEAGWAWTAVPAWAGFLLQSGYRWPSRSPRERRIALVSMPCDSAGAGLISLGAFQDAKGNGIRLSMRGIASLPGNGRGPAWQTLDNLPPSLRDFWAWAAQVGNRAANKARFGGGAWN